MIAATVLLVLAVQPVENVTTIDVAVIELNHMLTAEIVDETIPGKQRYVARESARYLNCWEWHHWERAYHVRDWCPTTADAEQVRYRDGRPEIRVYVRGQKFLIRGRVFRESWTFSDPEIEDGKLWPHENRRPFGLRTGR